MYLDIDGNATAILRIVVPVTAKDPEANAESLLESLSTAIRTSDLDDFGFFIHADEGVQLIPITFSLNCSECLDYESDSYNQLFKIEFTYTMSYQEDQKPTMLNRIELIWVCRSWIESNLQRCITFTNNFYLTRCGRYGSLTLPRVHQLTSSANIMEGENHLGPRARSTA